MSKALWFLVLTANLYVSAEKYSDPDDCPKDGLQKLIDGNTAFTGKFLYDAIGRNPNQNAVLSGYIGFQAIAQLALYAEGDTLAQILNTLNVRDKNDIRCVFPTLIQSLNSPVLSVASTMFVSDRYPLTNDFVKKSKKVFYVEPQTVDFTDNQEAADKINLWVKRQTRNRIENIIDADMIDQRTRLILANAIYFQANWQKQFKEIDTEERQFFASNDISYGVPTMKSRDFYNYAVINDLDCQVLQMFYKDNKYSFVIFLPQQFNGLNDMLEKLQNSNVFNYAYGNLSSTDVRVYIPKFRIESDLNLEPVLRSAGINDIFDSQNAALTGILRDHRNLYVDAAIQKSFCEVHEKGTVAAAAGVVRSVHERRSVAPPPEVFDANHPFAFYIMHEKTILFGGVYMTNQD